MSKQSRRPSAALLDGVAEVLRRHGYAPDTALLARALAPVLDMSAVFVPEAFAGDGPAVPDRETPDDDVNPVCGHRRRSACLGCGGCVDCDGCYCGEIDDLVGVPRRASICSSCGHDPCLCGIPAAVPVVAASTDDVERRVMRWQQVTDAVSAGLAGPPAEVRISDDGWSLHLQVPDEGQVRAWAHALAVGEVQVRVYSPGRGQVAREVFAARTHPFETRVSCAEALPPVPPSARKAAAAAGFVAVAG